MMDFQIFQTVTAVEDPFPDLLYALRNKNTFQSITLEECLVTQFLQTFWQLQFFQFTEMKWGYRALIRTLQNYRKRHGCQTIADFIKRWAPENENNTAGYISRVCSEMQVPNTYVPDINDKATMCAFAAAISRVENGVSAVMADIEAGWALL